MLRHTLHPRYMAKLAVFKRLIFSNNSEAFASELLENLKEMFLLYYMHGDIYLVTH